MKFTKAAHVLDSKIDDEIILLSMEANSYFGLDEVASRIWELLDDTVSFDELITLLMSEYEVDEAECRQDVRVFLDDMIGRGLVLETEA